METNTKKSILIILIAIVFATYSIQTLRGAIDQENHLCEECGYGFTNVEYGFPIYKTHKACKFVGYDRQCVQDLERRED